MIKAKDLYWIYEHRPEEERTNDKYFQVCARSHAQYLNALATNHKLSISINDNWNEQPTFLVTGRGSPYLVARVYLSINGWRAFFDSDVVTRSEVSFVNAIFNAIDDMMEKL